MNVFEEFALTLLVALGAAVISHVAFGRRQPISPVNRARRGILSERTANRIFLSMALIYSIVLTAMSILRHESFHSGGYDLGIFDQVIWNSLHGRLFANSIMLDSPSFLGHHFSPILLALVPLYALWTDPRMLLIAQTVALAGAAVPIYWFARKEIGALLAVVVAGAYYLYAPLQFVNLTDFHEIALATPLLAFTAYFMLRRHNVPFLVCLFLALLTKEEVSIIAIGFGLFILIVQRQKALGLVLTAFGIAWTIALLTYIIPSFRNPGMGPNYLFVYRYSYLGQSVGAIVRTALSQPGLVLQHLWAPSTMEFVLQILIPLAFLPLGGAEVFALALPTLGYVLISDDPFQTTIRSQYPAPLVPFIFFAAIIAAGRFIRWRTANPSGSDSSERRREVALGTLIGTASLLTYFFQSPAPPSLSFDASQYIVSARAALAKSYLAQIPVSASVLTDSPFIPHLSERQTIHQAPDVYDLRQTEYVFADTTFQPYPEYRSLWRDILSSPFFQPVADQQGFVFEKRAPYVPAHSMAVQFGQRITLLGYTVESPLPARRGENISFVLVWHADQDVRERLVVFAHLIDAQDHIWAQGDREPANGWFRTDRWNAGDVTPDRYALPVDASVLAGEYTLAIGLYDPVTGQRWTTNAGSDRVFLATAEIR